MDAFKTITLREWETCVLEGVFLLPEDQPFVVSLCESFEARVGIDQLLVGLRISTRSWVGVLRFTNFELRIVPKLADGDIGLLRLVDFTTGMRALDRYPANHTFDAEGSSLFDLIVLLFAEATERLSRSGLLADYKEQDDDLSVMRGRLRVREQITQRFGRVDRLECRFDEHTTNTIDNQLLLATLSVANRRVSNPGVAFRVRRLLGVLDEACTIDDFDLRTARLAITYTRQNEHYRTAHELGLLILDGLGINDLYTGSRHRTFAFLLDMNRLFEEFVTRWLTLLLRNTGYKATPQRRDRTILWDADSDRPYTSVIPDLVIERIGYPGRMLPVDAKYKLYDDRKLTTADIYQSFLYAFAYGQPTEQMSHGLIFYPSATDETPSHRLHIRQLGKHSKAELVAVGINLPAALSEAVAGRCGKVGSAAMSHLREGLDIEKAPSTH